MIVSKTVAGGALPAIFFLSCLGAAQPPAKSAKPHEPLGLVPVVWPRDNPYTPEKAALGRLPYFDPRLSADGTAQAITTFERTIMSGNSPYDRYRAGQKTAMTPSQVRGNDVFLNKAKCDACHEGVNFTSNMYANLGVGADKPDPDVGRFAVT